LRAGGHAELRVSSSDFGDPAPDEAGKALSLKYKPCRAWDVEGFGDALEKLQSAADAERAALRRAVKAQTKARLQFAREKQWVKFFTKAERAERGAAPEVVELLVGHRERICVKRSTLALCAESALAKQFNTEAAGGAGGGEGESENSDDSDDDDDDDDDDAIAIEAGARSCGSAALLLRS
jgi:hypothetical protein